MLPMQRPPRWANLSRWHELTLSDADLRFLVQTVATERGDHDRVIEIVRDKPDFLELMLDDEKLFRRVAEDSEVMVRISPWLLFSILIRRAVKELASERFTIERTGVTERIPVFDTERVAGLMRDSTIRDYLVDLLASFTRTDSTTVWYRSGRRIRRRTYSDMDVDDMIGLAGDVDPEQRFPFYKRVGDICLFIAGVYPEYLASGRVLSTSVSVPMRRGSWKRSLPEYVLEARRFYGLAAEHPQARVARMSAVLRALADNFELARKPLNLISDRYIKVQRGRLFGEGS